MTFAYDTRVSEDRFDLAQIYKTRDTVTRAEWDYL